MVKEMDFEKQLSGAHNRCTVWTYIVAGILNSQ